MENRTENRTATITLIQNPDGTLVIRASNQGMSLEKIGEGLIRGLEGQIFAHIVSRITNGDDSPHAREAFAQPIRAQVKTILENTPKVDEVDLDAVSMTIPGGLDVEG